MINDIMKNELTENEMNNVTGGAGSSIHDFCCNEADEKLFESFTIKEQCEVFDQPDVASRRAKMFEIWRRKR